MSNSNFDLAQMFSLVMGMEGGNSAKEGAVIQPALITPEMFAEMGASPYVDQMPTYVAFGPKKAFSTSDVIIAKFPVRVGEIDGRAEFLPSPKSVYGAERRLTQGSAMAANPFGDLTGPCRVNVDSATLMRLEADPDFGSIPVAYYTQRAYNPSKVEKRGFSVKFTSHNTHGLDRESQAAVNAMRSRIAEGLLNLKERIGASGPGTILVTLVGFCQNPTNITRSKSKDELRAEKDAYGDRANDLCVGVSFPEGGFILAAQPLDTPSSIGFEANRISAKSQASYRAQVRAAAMRIRQKQAPQFIPPAVEKPAAPVVPVAPAPAPAPAAKSDAADRLIAIGKNAAKVLGPDHESVVALRSLVRAARKGRVINNKLIADIAPCLGDVSSLKEFGKQMAANVQSKTPAAPAPAVEKPAAPAAAPAPAPTPAVEKPAAPAVEKPAAPAAAPAAKNSLLELMKNSGSMSADEEFVAEEPSSSFASSSAPAPVSVNADDEEIADVQVLTDW